MKTIGLLVLSASILFSNANAQINKGSVLLGGGLNISTTKSTQGGSEQTQRFLTFAPSIGVAVRANTVVGLNVDFGSSRYVNASGNSRAHTYGGGVFVRRFLPLGKNVYLAGEAALGYAHTNRTTVLATPASPIAREVSDQLSLGFTPSVTYAVGKRFQLQASINQLFGAYYAKSTQRQDSNPANELSSKSFGLQANLSSAAPLSIGFRIVLGK
ncbi:MAG: Autotransporter beta-domain protein [Flaviaesturariibacter sp.]|nr:Autotransporter beta-domain protein [Flaviaesturariibacter sp.]